MDEEEYIELQNLLTKYRVHCMKKFGDMRLSAENRHGYLLQIRHIDHLRSKMDMTVKVKKGDKKNELSKNDKKKSRKNSTKRV